MSIFYDNPYHRGKVLKPDTVQDIEKTTTSVPIVVMLPSIFGPIFCGEENTSWLLHRILKSWVDTKGREVKKIVRPILEWLIWIYIKGINEDTSAAETDITVVTLPSQNFKSRQKLRLDGTIGKWLEAQRVAEPQINSGLVVVAVTSFLASQAKSFLWEVKTLQ